jgi:hypothetical protein
LDSYALLARIQRMGRILVLVALTPALALGGDASLASTPLRQAHLRSGISVQLSDGWRILRGPLTACSDPTERFAAATFPASRLGPANAVPRKGALILLLEDHINPASGFSRRPPRFRLRGHATTFEGCCDTPTNPGYEFVFRDRGRDFEAFIFPGPQASPKLLDEATSVLNSLLVAG